MNATHWKSGFLMRAALATLLGTGAACVGAGDDDGAIAAAGDPVALSRAGRGLTPDTQFFIPAPNAGARARSSISSRPGRSRTRFGSRRSRPHRRRSGSGRHAGRGPSAVRKTMREAKAQRRVPILVAYNAPFRDCAQYSAGGATDTTAYKAWIDGFAAGIGGDPAVVILEPDSLGIIPYNTTIYGAADWCKPTVTDASGNPVAAPGASPDERYAQLNYAVDAIEAKAPRAMVYLDGTHSSWLGVGEAAYRLVKAGVQRAQGFFLNVSNYQPNVELAQFGTWVSDCVTAATAGADWAAGHFDWCPSQYDPALGYAVNYAPEYAATVTAGLVNMMGGAAATTHFVLDTGRNGQGPWHPTAVYPDAQDWCNPPAPRRRLAPDGDDRRAARGRVPLGQDPG